MRRFCPSAKMQSVYSTVLADWINYEQIEIDYGKYNDDGDDFNILNIFLNTPSSAITGTLPPDAVWAFYSVFVCFCFLHWWGSYPSGENAVGLF